MLYCLAHVFNNSLLVAVPTALLLPGATVISTPAIIAQLGDCATSRACLRSEIVICHHLLADISHRDHTTSRDKQTACQQQLVLNTLKPRTLRWGNEVRSGKMWRGIGAAQVFKAFLRLARSLWADTVDIKCSNCCSSNTINLTFFRFSRLRGGKYREETVTSESLRMLPIIRRQLDQIKVRWWSSKPMNFHWDDTC